MWRRHDKSGVENLLSFWTPLLLALLAVTSLLLRYVTDSIQCHYIYPQANEYFMGACFQQTSILMRTEEFVKFLQQSRNQDSSAKDFQNPFEVWPKQRTYHQWVPFALGVAAILCVFPHIVWRMLSGLLWLDTHSLVQNLKDNQRQKDSGRHVTLKDSALLIQVGLKGCSWMLTAAAMARKVLGLVVCVVQLVLIIALFKPSLGGAGGEEKRNLTNVNVTVPQSLPDVPLPTDPFFCSVDITQRSNQQSLTLQCLLPINSVFAKGFAFLFYFSLVLTVLSLWDILYWTGRLFLPHLRDATLLRHLTVVSQSEGDRQGSGLAHFSDFMQGLGVDGRLLLAMTDDECGPVTALDFTSHLWRVFKTTSRVGSPLPLGSSPLPLGSSPLPSGSDHESPSVSPWTSSVAGGNNDKKAADRNSGDIPLEVVGEQPPATDDDTAKLC